MHGNFCVRPRPALLEGESVYWLFLFSWDLVLPSCCLSFNGVPNPSPISNHPELQYLCTCTHTWWLPTHPILPIIIHQTHLLLTILDHLLRQCYQLLSLNLLQTHQPNMRGRERKLATELLVTYLIERVHLIQKELNWLISLLAV